MLLNGGPLSVFTVSGIPGQQRFSPRRESLLELKLFHCGSLASKACGFLFDIGFWYSLMTAVGEMENALLQTSKNYDSLLSQDYTTLCDSDAVANCPESIIFVFEFEPLPIAICFDDCLESKVFVCVTVDFVQRESFRSWMVRDKVDKLVSFSWQTVNVTTCIWAWVSWHVVCWVVLSSTMDNGHVLWLQF